MKWGRRESAVCMYQSVNTNEECRNLYQGRGLVNESRYPEYDVSDREVRVRLLGKRVLKFRVARDRKSVV